MTPTPTFLEAIAPLIVLAILLGLYRAARTVNAPPVHLGRPRLDRLTYVDPDLDRISYGGSSVGASAASGDGARGALPPYLYGGHGYTDMPLDSLVGHLQQEHFEVWNLLGERNPLPAAWRREHAADHGVRR